MCNDFSGGSFDLKVINQTKKPSGGNYGEIIITEYECPCGKGKIVLTDEKIPGYSDFYTNFDCVECNKNYELLWGKGVLPGRSTMIRKKIF